MGAGILPTTIHNNKLYFLFGKENQYETSAPGFSDFGGGTDNKESYLETAVREAGEEFTGFLGSAADVRKLLKRGVYSMDLNTGGGHRTYRMHIFPFEYNEWLPYYYNNNQRFLQKHLDARVIKSTRIFEKAEIRWICIDELPKMRSKFRHYFREMVDNIIDKKREIRDFIEKRMKGVRTSKARTSKARTRNTKTSKARTSKAITRKAKKA
jgi:8-oxo-dGTP pyrophosphatase MutT (NUDIX family)